MKDMNIYTDNTYYPQCMVIKKILLKKKEV